MSENQTPGPAPRNGGHERQDPWAQQQGAPEEAAFGAQRADAADDGSAANGRRHSPTERLDQQGDNPTQVLPGARPVYPQRQPFYGQLQTPEQHTPEQQEPVHPGHGGTHPNQPGYGYSGRAHQAGWQSGQDYNSTPGLAYNPKDAPRRKATFGVGTLVASILAAGLVGGSVATVGSAELFGNAGAATTATGNSQPGTVIVNNQDSVNEITAAAVKASPSVVTISASSGESGGTGSGIILDDRGHILTNTHVVTLDGQTANAALQVRTSEGRVIGAKLVGTDPLSDLAVIKVDNASGLTPATLGDSGKLNVGDTVIAIGSPLGLTGTVTDGIVSTLNRTISVASAAAPKEGDNAEGDGESGFQFAPPNGGQNQQSAGQGEISINVIQTDAAINPGNSGGALVNSNGDVIGVNVAIASAGSNPLSSTSGNIGVGFSIPINHAKRVAQEIIDTGKASHGQLGVSVKPKTASNSSSEFSVGADVATVEPDSAAAKAGIRVGDVITRFNDLTVGEPEQLTAAVREQPAGSKVKITVLRNGQEQTLDVTLGAAAS
ncbi:S1C family serine protease [Pseudarthrobacter sp. NamE5]|uniref:S1C family serine protease n=1 Tax=Pseudarthrobacter sp. NamE5 TaxID=2576839 RepID=UPI00110B08D2|nr:trypsin-like peptidase domain-containing protein [Pseudarthrobacter sp. NamE5]TLM86825.1 PDZ domain-containing protein [Pseudarthrobacter sp. NamE5]